MRSEDLKLTPATLSNNLGGQVFHPLLSVRKSMGKPTHSSHLPQWHKANWNCLRQRNCHRHNQRSVFTQKLQENNLKFAIALLNLW